MNNNNLASIYRQKYLPGSFGIQVGDCENPVQFKTKNGNGNIPGALFHPLSATVQGQSCPSRDPIQ